MGALFSVPTVMVAMGVLLDRVVRTVVLAMNPTVENDRSHVKYTGSMTHDDTAEMILDTAERLYYAKGFAAVGMDELRQSAGVSLRRLYSLYPSKSDIVMAVLARKHDRWARELDAHLAGETDPIGRLLAVYDYLSGWFRADDFRGCGFINAFGELGGQDESVAAAVRAHKASFQRRVADLVDQAGGSPQLAAQLAILAEGAQTTAAIAGDPSAASDARAAAEVLIQAAMLRQPEPSLR
jgi:AcrR family transcriptional regulator